MISFLLIKKKEYWSSNLCKRSKLESNNHSSNPSKHMKYWNIKEQLWTIYNFNGPLLRVKFNSCTVAVLLKIFLKSSQIHVHYFDEEVSAIWSWIEEQPCRLESKTGGRKQETRGRKSSLSIEKCWENRSPHKKYCIWVVKLLNYLKVQGSEKQVANWDEVVSGRDEAGTGRCAPREGDTGLSKREGDIGD